MGLSLRWWFNGVVRAAFALNWAEIRKRTNRRHCS